MLFIAALGTMGTAMQSVFKGSAGGVRTSGPRLEEFFVVDNHTPTRIAVITISGIISSDIFGQANYGMVEYIRDQFKVAKEDNRVRAVILRVESPGGEVLASDEISKVITDFQKESGKPVVASMGTVAASGGYYVAAPCRWIVANELSITGSIGVIFHSFNYRGLMDKVGLRPEVYKSGKYKDMLSGDKREEEITPEERQMIRDLIQETFGKFKSVVEEGRAAAYAKNTSSGGAGRKLDDEWVNYADGRIFSGKQAYDLGFVDELGNFDAAIKRAMRLAGVSNASLVEYQQIFDLSNFFRLFGKSEPTKLQVELTPETMKLKAGRLYFLSPTFLN